MPTRRSRRRPPAARMYGTEMDAYWQYYCCNACANLERYTICMLWQFR